MLPFRSQTEIFKVNNTICLTIDVILQVEWAPRPCIYHAQQLLGQNGRASFFPSFSQSAFTKINYGFPVSYIVSFALFFQSMDISMMDQMVKWNAFEGDVFSAYDGRGRQAHSSVHDIWFVVWQGFFGEIECSDVLGKAGNSCKCAPLSKTPFRVGGTAGT